MDREKKRKIKCSVCDSCFTAWFSGKPYCNKHWLRLYAHGTTDKVGRKSTNSFEIDGDILTITTKNGEKILADAANYEKLSKPSWCISKTGYAVATINKKVVKMSRAVLGVDDCNIVADHKNGNKLDNRVGNLRICTAQQNSKNQGAKNKNNLPVGIRITKHGKYNARIFFNGKGIHIGNFSTLEEAVNARNNAEDKYFGEFAQHLYRDVPRIEVRLYEMEKHDAVY